MKRLFQGIENGQGMAAAHRAKRCYAEDGVPEGGIVEGYTLYNTSGEQAVSFGGYDVSVKTLSKAASTVSTVSGVVRPQP